MEVYEHSTASVLNTNVMNARFLPTTRAEKYKAEQATDAIFWRTGDVLSAGLVFAGLHWLGFSVQPFAFLNIVLVLFWIALAIAIGRRFTRLTAAG